LAPHKGRGGGGREEEGSIEGRKYIRKYPPGRGCDRCAARAVAMNSAAWRQKAAALCCKPKRWGSTSC